MELRPPSRDRTLVLRVQAQAPGALDELIERLQCVPRMLASKNSQMGRPFGEAELQDLSQDCLTVIWKKLSEFSGKSALETWVYSICFLELLWRLRKQRRSPVLLEDLESSMPEREGESLPSALDFEHVHQSLDKLAPVEAEAVRLKHFEELTFVQIGQLLSVSPNTIKARYYRGLFRLRRIMGVATRCEVTGGGE